MNKAHQNENWVDFPSRSTAINATRLNRLDKSVDEIDNRVVAHDTTLATKTEVANTIVNIEFDEKTGVITATRKNNTVITIDTLLEKIAINFGYDPKTQKITITLEDGTYKEIDLSALITEYEFEDTESVSFLVSKDGKVSAKIIDGSITEAMLEPTYLAQIKVSVASADSSAKSASTSATNARNSETNAKTSETNANESALSAESSANLATTKASEANSSAVSANSSADKASASSSSASASANNAKNSEINASKSASTSTSQATKSESYAVGGTNSRTGENTDNAKYYKEQAQASSNSASTSASTATTKATEANSSANSAKSSASTATTKASEAVKNAEIALAQAQEALKYAQQAEQAFQNAKSLVESMPASIRPKGDIKFSQLPSVSYAVEGDMYNIKDEFITTSDFTEGAGVSVPSGSEIYLTTDRKWSIYGGTGVVGVKGNAETSYRTGNVNITPANIGLGNVNNTSDSNKSVKYATSSGSATSATKATQDGSGNNIVSTYAKKNDNTDANGLMNALTVGTSNPTDSDYYISQYAGGGTTNVTYHRRPLSALWSWIKGKLATVAISGNYADLAGKPTQMPASDVYSWAKQSTKPTYTASEVGALSSSGNAVSATKASKLSNTSAIGSTTKPVYFTSNGVPSACTYSLGKSVPSDAKFTDTNTWRPVQNNLTSTSTTDCLSAYQGKLLNDSLKSKSGYPDFDKKVDILPTAISAPVTISEDGYVVYSSRTSGGVNGYQLYVNSSNVGNYSMQTNADYPIFSPLFPVKKGDKVVSSAAMNVGLTIYDDRLWFCPLR